jgi:hypothetical protein
MVAQQCCASSGAKCRTTWKPLLFVLAYLIFGTLSYTFVFTLEGPSPAVNASWVDAAYFSLVTLTTVGYGDFHPGSDDVGARLFTVFFAILGICFVGWALGTLVEGALEKVTDQASAGDFAAVRFGGGVGWGGGGGREGGGWEGQE